MKRIEVVMNHLALDAFKQSAAELGIVEFDVSQVRRASAQHAERQRLYRGQEFTVDLLERSKVEFAVFDDDATRIVHDLIEAVHPDSISIFKIDAIVSLERGNLSEKGQAVPRSTVDGNAQSTETMRSSQMEQALRGQRVVGMFNRHVA
jgi:nitrogen regulatory protein PII